MSKKFLVILCLSLGIRLIGLNQSLWLDEAISANVAKSYSYQEIITSFSPTDFHPPLYCLTLKAWTSVFGYSEISLRFPSVLFALFSIILVFRFFGFWPSLLLSLNPLFVYYSQEARMYSMATFLVFCSFLAFKQRRLFLYGLFTFLSLSTFYGTVFFFAAISLYFLTKKKYKEFFIYSLPPLFSLIFLSPLLIAQYQNSRTLLSSVLNWRSVLGTVSLKNLLLIPIKFTIGRISFYPKWIYYFISALVAFPLWSLMFIKSFRHRLPAFIFWVTLSVGFIFSLFTPGFQYFRFLYLLPFLCLLINKNIFYSVVFLVFSLIYLLNPTFHREDWKTLTAALPSTVYMIPSAADPVKYYRPDILLKDPSSIPNENGITVVPYLAPIHGINYSALLTNHGYHLTKISSFRLLTTESWTKNP